MTPHCLTRHCLLATTLLLSAKAYAQDTPTLVILRPIPKEQAKTHEVDLNTKPIVRSDLTEIRIGGKPAPILSWTPLLNSPTILQLVVLIDPKQPISIDEIKTLFVSLPSNVEIAVAYMVQGKAKITQPFTIDRVLANNALHTPTIDELRNLKNVNGDPYYCLHDLAANWPNPDPKKLRAVLVFTDGIVRHPNTTVRERELEAVNPDIASTTLDLMRAGITPFAVGGGGQLVANTNGQAFPTVWTSYSPLYEFFSILYTEAVVTVAAKGDGFKPLDIKSASPDLKVAGPDQVMIGNAMPRR